VSGVRASLPVQEKKKIMLKKIKESYNELVHKVSWPTMSEVTSSAVVVLEASLLIALVVFSMDQVFQMVMELIYSL
jgi:preprotein translocase subunit SecE